jgi:ribosomal protein S18 acetylase RimI-like enzyme
MMRLPEGWSPQVELVAQEILSVVGRDPLYFTLIADLTTLADRCRFALGDDGTLVARYLDLPFPAVSFYGEGAGLRHALRALIEPGEDVYTLVGEAQRAQLGAVVRVLHIDEEWQMVYEGELTGLDEGDAAPLTERDWPAMRALAQVGELLALESSALQKGPYFGVWRDGRLVSMAGTHLQRDQLAEIGNVVTHPEYRRHGLATRVVAAVIRALRAKGKGVFLQVFKDNPAAISLYEKMGFRRAHSMYLVRFRLDEG